MALSAWRHPCNFSQAYCQVLFHVSRTCRSYLPVVFHLHSHLPPYQALAQEFPSIGGVGVGSSVTGAHARCTQAARKRVCACQSISVQLLCLPTLLFLQVMDAGACNIKRCYSEHTHDMLSDHCALMVTVPGL